MGYYNNNDQGMKWPVDIRLGPHLGQVRITNVLKSHHNHCCYKLTVLPPYSYAKMFCYFIANTLVELHHVTSSLVLNSADSACTLNLNQSSLVNIIIIQVFVCVFNFADSPMHNLCCLFLSI